MLFAGEALEAAMMKTELQSADTAGTGQQHSTGDDNCNDV